MVNIRESTLKDGLCIGCGICSVVCPKEAISMIVGEERDLVPEVKTNKCINCGLCLKICPNSFETLQKENKKINDSKDYLFYGFKNAKCFVGNVKEKGQNIRSASGGIASYIAMEMLQGKQIDAVIHAKNVESRNGEIHYIGTCSVTASELEATRGTVYGAVSFADCVKEACEKDAKRVLFIGTPCVVRAVQNMNLYAKKFDELYLIALACSHNVCNMFTDYMAETMCVPTDIPYVVNFRDKKDSLNSNEFNTFFTNSNGFEIRKNRFESEFTTQWRGYSFSKQCCNACSDFWGYSADVSLKDAWGKWSNNKYGKNIVVVRNSKLMNLLQSDKLQIKEISIDEAAISQKETVDYKQKKVGKKLKASSAKDYDRIDIVHYLNATVRNLSKKVINPRGIYYITKISGLMKRAIDNKITQKLF